MTALAREVGMSRMGLNKALSGEGNPTLSTVMKVAKALGLKITIQPEASWSSAPEHNGGAPS